jgi:hypothetical protein
MGAGRWKLKEFENKHEFHKLAQIKFEIPLGMTKLRTKLNTKN